MSESEPLPPQHWENQWIDQAIAESSSQAKIHLWQNRCAEVIRRCVQLRAEVERLTVVLVQAQQPARKPAQRVETTTLSRKAMR
jgi:hypothetical protein